MCSLSGLTFVKAERGEAIGQVAVSIRGRGRTVGLRILQGVYLATSLPQLFLGEDLGVCVLADIWMYVRVREPPVRTQLTLPACRSRARLALFLCADSVSTGTLGITQKPAAWSWV